MSSGRGRVHPDTAPCGGATDQGGQTQGVWVSGAQFHMKGILLLLHYQIRCISMSYSSTLLIANHYDPVQCYSNTIFCSVI